MYKYRYPFIGSKAQRVPAAALPLIALAFPSLVIVAHALLAGAAAALLGSHHHPPPSRLEAHAALLGLFASVVSTGAATNLLKIGVGRPRPNFGVFSLVPPPPIFLERKKIKKKHSLIFSLSL